MLEENVNINEINIKYKHKKRKYDTQHLIVIFSGFGGSGEFTYDFEDALQDCPAEILWIKDDFYDHCTYYICHAMNFKVAEAINSFINERLSLSGLSRDQCTLAGFSKGASAALYYGVKYNFINIISTVPQFYIGSYVADNWPSVAKNMMGDVADEKILILDNILPDLIKNDSNKEKNIYLLTSEADSQFLKQIYPNLQNFIKYKNFNLLMAQSILVREHNQVTVHHLPLLLGIFYSLSQGATPYYGYTELKGDALTAPENPSCTPLAVLKKIRVENNFIYPEGLSVLKGISCAENKDIFVKLILKSENNYKELNLAKAHMPYLTRALYDGSFVNYDKGWFCSHMHEGIDMTDLPSGKYKISLAISCQGIMKEKEMTVDNHMKNRIISGSDIIKIVSEENNVFVIKH